MVNFLLYSEYVRPPIMMMDEEIAAVTSLSPPCLGFLDVWALSMSCIFCGILVGVQLDSDPTMPWLVKRSVQQ